MTGSTPSLCRSAEDSVEDHGGGRTIDAHLLVAACCSIATKDT